MKSLVLATLSIFIFSNVILATSPEDLPGPPALTCVIIGDAACQRMCTMLGRIYAAPTKPAVCDSNNNCDCTMIQHKGLDDLWREKFTSTEFLETVETDETRYRYILNAMRTPYQTREQTKRELEVYFDPDDFARIQVNDNVAEKMIKTNASGKEILDHDSIRSFVSQSLQSDPLQLPSDFCYKSKLKAALANAPDEDTLQYMIHDLRRSKNPDLNGIADEFLKEKGIQEEIYLDDDDDNFTDILDLNIVTEYINPSPITSPSPTTSGQNEAKADQWDLPGLDLASVEAFKTGYRCWTNDKDYNVCQLKANWGDIQLTWIKGKDYVEITVDESGETTQNWKLDDGVEISLTKNSAGDLKQTWKFAKDSQFEYVKNKEAVDEKWLNDKKNDEALTKYKALIDSWCQKNGMFIEREYCVIY